MKTAVKVLWAISLALALASLATCYFGAEHAVHQIPPEVRARMSDTDWIGVEWIGYGLFLGSLAVILALAALTLRIRQRRHSKT